LGGGTAQRAMGVGACSLEMCVVGGGEGGGGEGGARGGRGGEGWGTWLGRSEASAHPLNL
jgi:hypothetical protein